MMRTNSKVWPLAIVMLTIGFVSADGRQDTAPPPEGPALVPVVLRGEVVDASTGVPQAGVAVRLAQGPIQRVRSPRRDPTARSVTSDGNGSFQFEVPRGTKVYLSAAAKGYVPGDYGQAWPEGSARPIVVDDIAPPDRFVVKLWKAASVEGVVTATDGTPLAGIRVYALLGEVQSNTLQPAHVTVTDADGQYRFDELIPGRYAIAVLASYATLPLSSSARSTVPTKAQAVRTTPTGTMVVTRERYAVQGQGRLLETTGTLALTAIRSQYFPRSETSPQVPLMLVPGDQRRNVDFALERAPMRRLTGTLFGPDGPVGRANVELTKVAFAGSLVDQRLATGFTVTNEEGQFVMEVPDGAYELRALKVLGKRSVGLPTTSEALASPVGLPSTNYPMGDVLWTRMPVIVGEAYERELNIQLLPGSTLSGRIVSAQRDREIEIPAGALVVLHAATSNAATARLPIQPDGTFSSTDFLPGEYTLSVAGLPEWHVASIRVGADDAARGPASFVAGENYARVEMSQASSTLTVRLPRSASNATVSVFAFPADWTRAAGSRFVMAHLPSGSAEISFGSVLPGDYVVAAIEDPQFMYHWLTPEIIERLATVGRRITVPAAAAFIASVGPTTMH